MNASTLALALLSTAIMAGCGGGNSNSPAATLAASVSTVVQGTLMYSKPSSFTVTGKNLDLGITLVSPFCSGMIETVGGTATQRVFSCTPTATGAITVSVQAAGVTLASISPMIPLPRVTMKTTLGDVVLELYPSNAPLTVTNFLQYVSADFYSNLIFHRVVPNFVIQGGGFNTALQQAVTRAPIKLEVPNGLSNLRGTVAMARTTLADSATSQFFINTVDNVSLDTSSGGYAVFGKVVTGLPVVDQIAAVPTQTVGGLTGVPVTAVVINSMVQTQ